MRFPLPLPLLVAGCVATADPAAPGGLPSATAIDASLIAERTFRPAENDGGTLSITVDATDPGSRRLGITERIEGWTGEPPMYFKALGRKPEHTYHDVRAFAPDGEELTLRAEKDRWIVEGYKGDTVELRYQAQPGGLGRHGHQGLIEPGWAVFDGRVYLQPKGAMGLGDVRLKFEMPPGWDAHTPFRDAGDGWWSLDVMPDRVLFEALQTSCVGLGPFDHDDRTYGETEVRIAAFRGWSDEHKKLVFDKSHRMANWFHQTLGFDVGFPFHFVFVPMPGKDRVFGGAWSNGACYEQPTDRQRNWELMGHRFAHPMNKYNPSGLTILSPRDHWFMEGWASYIELVSTAETGIAAADQRSWNGHYNWYLRERAHHPGFDLPLADEKKARGDGAEFMHYAKGPLVAKLLDEEIRAKTDTTLEAFFAHLYKKFGNHKAPVPLREELAAFTGEDFSSFWARHVDQQGAVVPIWAAGELSRPAAEAMMEEPPMAMVGDRRIHPSFLHYLTYAGGFERFEEVERWLEEAVARRADFERRGFRPWPAWMYEVEYGLHPAIQWNLMEAELAWPLEHLPPAPAHAAPASGCGGGAPPPAAEAVAPTFSLIDAHPSALTWKRLRESENAYVQNLMHTGLEAIQAHREFEAGDPPVGQPLGFGPKQPFVGMAVWLAPPAEVFFEVLADGKPTSKKRRVVPEPGWHRTWLTMDADDRPEREAVLTVRVYDGDTLVNERAFWQRTLPPAL